MRQEKEIVITAKEGRETDIYMVEQKKKKKKKKENKDRYSMPPCLTLSIIRYRSRVSGTVQEKE